MAIKDGADYVKFVTERFVAYIETPVQERRQLRSRAKSAREPWLARWFGWGGCGLLLWWRSRRTAAASGEAGRLPEQAGETAQLSERDEARAVIE